MGNMLEQMKKAQQLVQVEAAQVQTELANTDFEGYSKDETVRVIMSGNQEPRSVDFTDEALEQGPEKLSELTLAAMKDAHSQSVQGMKDRMGGLAKKLGIPADGFGGGGM